MTPRLNDSEPLETALRRMAVESIDTALGALDASDGRDVAIHTVRKEGKRSRALLRLFRFAIGDGARRECRFFRDLGRSLSQARDAKVVLDVHAMLIDRFRSVLDPAVDATVRQQLIASIQSAREAAGADPTPDSDALRQQLLAARLRARRWTLSGDSDEMLKQGFVRSYRRARKAAQLANAAPHASHYHELRKRAKDFWYQLELVARRWPDSALQRIAPVRRLTELLGNAHDLVVYAEAIEKAAASRMPEAVEMLAAVAVERRRALETEARELGLELFGPKPKRFAAELERREIPQQAAG